MLTQTSLVVSFKCFQLEHNVYFYSLFLRLIFSNYGWCIFAAFRIEPIRICDRDLSRLPNVWHGRRTIIGRSHLNFLDRQYYSIRFALVAISVTLFLHQLFSDPMLLARDGSIRSNYSWYVTCHCEAVRSMWVSMRYHLLFWSLAQDVRIVAFI